MMPSRLFATLTLLLLTLSGVVSAELPVETARAVDGTASKALKDTDDPGISLAVVKDGKLLYAKAYGLAWLEPALPATPQMRYQIGSNSKHLPLAESVRSGILFLRVSYSTHSGSL